MDISPSAWLPGFQLVDPLTRPDVYTELFRTARLIRDQRRKVVGLVPATRRVGVPAVGLQLGAALGDACRAPVVLVDANTRWPGLPSLVPAAWLSAEANSFTPVWLTKRLAVLLPVGPRRAGLELDLLQTTLVEQCGGFPHALVDLTGFEVLGEHLAAYEFMDGVLVVAYAGRTTERQLLDCQRQIQPSKQMGVLLVS